MRKPAVYRLALALALVAAGAGLVARTPQPGIAVPAHTEGQLREFTLVAKPVRWEIQPGLVMDGWGYNGQIPGPTLRVTEGDLVRITLVNHLPVPTTIHWHGIDVPSQMDGVPGLSQEAVEPGESFVYEFTASNPGTRMYHSHTDTDAQMQLGLVGAFIVEPRQPELVRYDREFTYILTEKALDFTPAVALGNGDILHRDAGNGRGGQLQSDLFLMNERAASAVPPMTIAAGERIRIRLINLGNLVHAMHLHGHSFRIVATDGNPVPPAAQVVKDTVSIGPGERYDLAVEGKNPGVWLFHCHINNHAANGMTTVLAYEGAQAPAGGSKQGSHGPAAPLPVGLGITATPAGLPPATPAVTLPASGTSESGADEIVMLDNRFRPARLTVRAGRSVTWTNSGSNLHTATSIDGQWDSGSLTHAGRFTYTFSLPGTYRFFCRQHLDQGMTGTITVEPP